MNQNTAVSSGISRESERDVRIKNTQILCKPVTQKPIVSETVAQEQSEEESVEESENSEEEVEGVDDYTHDFKQTSPKKRITGVVPKDLEQKKEMMSFIAYAQHIESACKLITCSK
mgnify:CR=1 FL=1